jgi:hypothetical protein
MIPGTDIHGARGVSGGGIHCGIQGIIPGIITIGTIDACNLNL